eukprot:TRINITY_DN1279_c2_g1_i1.p2 TRINITY_DN1279_c2_g1~~TRINITY_DN1279_c2_g1_i1.p2  ORF type:complete len:496 (+),score=168.61 TRINITY_DN1279_c2_g1_i1:57-1490(+)
MARVLLLAACAAAAAVVDKPGLYRIVHEGASVTPERDSGRGAARVGRLISGMEVDVLEVSETADGERVRGRIESPVPGWMTLGYAKTAKKAKKPAYRWALPAEKQQAAAPKGTGEIVTATDDNYFKLKKNPLVFLVFHADENDSKTGDLLSAMKEASLKLEGRVVFAKVDVTEETELAAEHLGEGFDERRLPVVLVRTTKIHRYDGPRTADGIVRYMESVLSITGAPGVRDVADEKDLAVIREKYATVAVAFVAEGTKEDKAWAAVSEKHKAELAFARSRDAAFAKRQGVTMPGVKVFPKHGGPQVYRGGVADTDGGEPGDAVMRFIRTASLLPFGQIMQSNFLNYAEAKVPLVWLFLDESEASMEARREVLEVVQAGKFGKRARFAWADARTGFGRQIAQRLGAYEKDGDVTLKGGAKDLGRLPTIAFTDDMSPVVGHQQRGAVFPVEKPLTGDAIEEWVAARLGVVCEEDVCKDA